MNLAPAPRRGCTGFQWFLAGLTASMLSFCLYALVFREIPTGNRDILIGLTGALGMSGWAAILNFEFGSSRASQSKDDTISALSKG